MDEKLQYRPPTSAKEREIELVASTDGARQVSADGAEPSADDHEGVLSVTPVPEALLEKYECLSHVATGGMASVFRAKHRLTGQNVAIKVLADRRDQSIERFKREAATVASLTHGNIVHIYDFGVAGTAYITMEYVEGHALAELIASAGKLPLERFYAVFSDVCAGLAHAHRKGVVHRDIKPSNILIQDASVGEETAKLADFGLAKALAGEPGQEISQTGEILGTPLYMSPEQCMGSAAGKPSDIYSLGCVMYECLTGQPPIKGANFLETVWYRLNEKPKTFADLGVKVPTALEEVVFRCLAQNPAHRYETVEALAADLDCCRLNKAISHFPAAAGSETAGANPGIGPLGMIAGTLVSVTVACMVLGAALWMRTSTQPTPATSPPPVSTPAPPPVPTAIPRPLPRAPHAVPKLPALASRLFLMMDLRSGAAGQKEEVLPFHNQGDGLSDKDYGKLRTNPQVKLATEQWTEYYQKIFDELRPADGSIPKGARLEMSVTISGDGKVYASTKWADPGDQRVQQFYNEVVTHTKSLSGQPWIKPPDGRDAVEFSYWVESEPEELRLGVINQAFVPEQQ